MQDHNTDSLREALREAVAALQARRAVLGDELTDAALAPLQQRLSALQAAPPPVRRLRQVSVLFLDIVGSTQLIQHMDPEDVQSVVDGALAAFSALVRQHGGEVLRYGGDNLKAAFGADHSREDDAERAVACGLALLQEARRRGAAVRQAHGSAGFDARVGIHTGPVVRGGGVEQHNSLSGLAVHVAARMEQAAPPGTLRISRDTYRLVQGRVEVLEQPALQVKGLQEPMRTYLVQSLRERRLRGLRQGADGVSSRLVGREAEWARLQQGADRVLAPGGGLQRILVVGDAGLGKSRLLAELQASLAPRLAEDRVWRASSHPQTLYQPYGLLRDLMLWHLGVRDSDTQAEAQRSFAAALRPVFGDGADEQTALLGQLIGLDYSDSPFIAGILRDGRQLQARGFNAWLRYLRLQAARSPLVLVLDDLQWADDESLNALEQLLAIAPELPALLLCAARPELLQRRPDWGRQGPQDDRLELAPLASAGSSALAEALLERFAAPVPALQALLSQQAAGNPYYMEALLQMLVDTGVVQADRTPWQLQEERLQGLPVPPTLVGVLQATLDALDEQARRSLQHASVVGAQFWEDSLAAIDPQAPAQLPQLSRRELALPQAESAFEGTREYSFRHHLLHQVTYGTVLKPDKRQAHGQAARWLQARGQGRENELAGQIAEHFERAGDTGQAIVYWLRAAEDASRRHADVAALAHADRALALDDGQDLRRLVRLHRVRGDVFMRSGDSAAHGREVDILEALADRTDDDVLRLGLANDRVWRLFLEARYDDAVALAEERLARAEARSPRDAGRVHNVTYLCLARLGRSAEAMAHAQRGLEQAAGAGDLNTVAAIHTNIGVVTMEAGQLSLALSHYQQALQAYQAAGNRSGVANVRLNLAQIETSLGRVGAACELLQHVVHECAETGARRHQAMACGNLGAMLAEAGEPERGYATALEGLRLARLSADGRTEAWIHHNAQNAAALMGRYQEALDHAQAACAGFRTHRDPSTERINAGAVVRNLQALGRHADALAAADALLAEVDAEGGWGEAFEPAYYVYSALAALGDPRAPALLDSAHTGLDRQADQLADHVPRDEFLSSTEVARAIGRAWAASRHGGDRAPANPPGRPQ